MSGGRKGYWMKAISFIIFCAFMSWGLTTGILELMGPSVWGIIAWGIMLYSLVYFANIIGNKIEKAGG